MVWQKSVRMLLFMGFLSTSAHAADIPYQFTTLDLGIQVLFAGTPRADIVRFSDINTEGWRVGTDFTGGGYVVSPDGEVTEIKCPNDLRDDDNTTAYIVNNAGYVVGYCVGGTPMDRRLVGFIRAPGGEVALLEFPGADGTFAYGLNDSGTVVGQYFGFAFGEGLHRFHGFIFQDGAYQSFDAPFDGAFATALLGVNQCGQIIGTYNHQRPGATDLNDADSTPAFLYDQVLGTTTALVVPGTDPLNPCCEATTLPMDINNHGTIVLAGIPPSGRTQDTEYFLRRDAEYARITGLPEGFFAAIGNWGLNDADHLAGAYLTRILVCESCGLGGDPVFRFEVHAFVATPVPTVPTPDPLPEPPLTLALTLPGDFNGDGLLDAVGLDAFHRVWRVVHGGEWQKLPIRMQSLFVGDLDESGTDDLAGLDFHGSLWAWTSDESGWRPLSGRAEERTRRMMERRAGHVGAR
jgi:hypothetical protein